MVIEWPGIGLEGRRCGYGIRLAAIQGCRFANSDGDDRAGTRHQFDDFLAPRRGSGNVGAATSLTWWATWWAAAAADQRGAQTRAQPAKAANTWTGFGHQKMAVISGYGMPFRGKRMRK